MGRFSTDWSRLDGPLAHVAISTIALIPLLLFTPLPWWFWLAVNTAGWTLWEMVSGALDGKGANPFSGRWGWRKRSEMIAPILSGSFVCGAFYAISRLLH